MKKLLIMCLVCFVTMTFASTSAFAASAKASAQFLGIQSVGLSANIAEAASGSWTTVFTQAIHTANDHDVYISPSFEVGLTTNTAVMSKKLARAIANAEAQVKVRVMLDGNEVDPGEVIYSKREQTLIAEFAGFYDLWDAECVQTTTNDDGAITGITFSDADACFDAEYLQLILNTMAAHTFNFIATDVTSGDHTIQVQVMLTYDLGDGLDIYDRPDLEDDVLAHGMAGSQAWIGKGSVLIDVVRMVKGEDVIPMD
jgi:hypothetical protein